MHVEHQVPLPWARIRFGRLAMVDLYITLLAHCVGFARMPTNPVKFLYEFEQNKRLLRYKHKPQLYYVREPPLFFFLVGCSQEIADQPAVSAQLITLNEMQPH